jgi:ferredoxin
MPTVTVEGEKSFEVPMGKKLVLGIEDAGIDILHRCGGFARCTTCRVQFVSGEPSEMGKAERETLEEDGLLGEYRLSCQIRLGDADMAVKVWGRASEKGIPPGDRPED